MERLVFILLIMGNQKIVILHGWGICATTFNPLAREFRKIGYDVYTPDMPGFGKTAVPNHPLMLTDYVRFLDAYLKKNKIISPVLIGHSFGGRVSLKYNQLHPNRVSALILSGTPGFTPIAKKKLLLFIALAKIGKIFICLPPFKFFRESIRGWYYYVIGARDYVHAQGFMRDTFKNIVKEDLVSAMESVRLPCLLLWGEEDNIVPLSIAQRMEHVIAGSKLLYIADCDHGVSYKKPHIFAGYVRNFLSSLS